MGEVHESITLDANAQRVWELIGQPGDIAEWAPLDASSMEGDIRVCTMPGVPGEIRERITRHSDEDRSYSYEIVSAPLPVSNYHSTISVSDADGGSRVDWKGEFEPAEGTSDDDVVQMVAGVYRGGLDSLRAHLQG
jgi:hypothetical protein